MRELHELGRLLNTELLPCPHNVLEQFIVYLLTVRDPPLDASSVVTIINAVNTWHQQLDSVIMFAHPPMSLSNPARSATTRAMLKIGMAKFKRPPLRKLHLTIAAFKDVVHRGFNQASRYGRQQFLFALICMAAPLRPGAAKYLTCDYHLVSGILCTM